MCLEIVCMIVFMSVWKQKQTTTQCSQILEIIQQPHLIEHLMLHGNRSYLTSLEYADSAIELLTSIGARGGLLLDLPTSPEPELLLS